MAYFFHNLVFCNKLFWTVNIIILSSQHIGFVITVIVSISGKPICVTSDGRNKSSNLPTILQAMILNILSKLIFLEIKNCCIYMYIVISKNLRAVRIYTVTINNYLYIHVHRGYYSTCTLIVKHNRDIL